ncbi:MAG: CDF family Co(II)/Ni(II) efflux transporter DmeF [Myxococcales bacterium]
MHPTETQRFEHSHTFGADQAHSGEHKTRQVVALTVLTMLGEIVAGMAFGSMSLQADGWHMGTHAIALGVAAFAYSYARRHASDRRYTFGTGKVGALAGFGSAVGLAVVALLVVGESALRLASPAVIAFDEAIAVAVLGLAVNLASAFLLGGHAPDDHEPEAGHVHHRDHNLRGAYLHVLADAVTSVLAIVALLAGKALGWTWLDPLVGMVGGVVIARWSLGLLRDTGAVLLDGEVPEERQRQICELIERDGDDHVTDLHVWRVGPEHLAAIVSVVTRSPRSPGHYKELLKAQADLAHVTVEVQGIGAHERAPAAA